MKPHDEELRTGMQGTNRNDQPGDRTPLAAAPSRRHPAAMLAAALATSLAAGPPAQAAFTFTITESGSGVVINGAGTINTTALGEPSVDRDDRLVFDPAAGQLGFAGEHKWIYTGLQPNTGFGTGGSRPPDNWDFDSVLIDATNGLLIVPYVYASGTPLHFWMIFYGESFATLGLAPGSTVYTVPSDTITVTIGAAVPEPAAGLLLGAGLLGLGLVRRRPAPGAR